MLMNIIKQIEGKTLPIIEIETPQDVIPLSQILIEEGLTVIEITLRTPGSIEAIKLLREEHPYITIGAGTVLTNEQAKEAVEAGADFIVSPGFDPELVKYAISNKIVIIPGVNNPSQIQQALSFGLKTLKFFPAELSGGIKYLTAMGSVYRDVKFIPSGGINSNNLQEYIQLKNVFAVGGSWMVKRDFINSKNWDMIRTLVKEVVLLTS